MRKEDALVIGCLILIFVVSVLGVAKLFNAV
jgi:hypothetical protein